MVSDRVARMKLEYIAMRVAEKLREIQSSEKRIVGDHYGDKVWSFDVEIERFLRDLVRDLFPNSVLVTEESEYIRLSSNPELSIIVDPVDGSANYAAGIPWYATCIALAPIDAESLDMVVASAIAVPTTKDLYSYSRSEGVLENGRRVHRGRPQKMISVYFDTLDQYRVIDCFCSKHGRDTKVRSLGCISLDMLYVALGRIEGVIDLRQRLRNTDIAAVYPVLRALGARFVCTNRRTIPANEFVKGLSIAAFYNEEAESHFSTCLAR